MPDRGGAPIALLVVLAVAACGAPATDTRTAPVPAGGGAPGGTAVERPPDPSLVEVTGTTGPLAGRDEPALFVATSTTVPAPVTVPAPADCAPTDGRDPLDGTATAALESALADLRGAGGRVAVAVATETNGEIVAEQPDAAMAPASNQKLLVAHAALDLLPADTTLDTVVVATGVIAGGTTSADLVLVGGGDPTLTRSGPHSLADLARQVRAAGITRVEGRLLVDDTRYDRIVQPDGWPASLALANVGPLSAVVVDRNRDGTDPGTASDPAMAAGRAFVAELQAAGVEVTGGVARGTAALGLAVARASSPPLRDLVVAILSGSDNLAAELLVKELGYRRSGAGTTSDGLAAAVADLGQVCGLALAAGGNRMVDGSGLSSHDRLTARTIRQALDAARTRPWFLTFQGALAVAGRTGTLATRLTGPSTAGRVRAKTGSTGAALALSGYLTSTRHGTVTFAVLVDRPGPGAEAAVDRYVSAMAAAL